MKITKITVFTIFYSLKTWNIPKILEFLLFVPFYITYTQNRGNGNSIIWTCPYTKILYITFFEEYIWFRTQWWLHEVWVVLFPV